MSTIAQHYGLSDEQLMEIYHVLLKEAGLPFHYINNKTPAYKTTEGKWETLVGKDPYALSKTLNVDLFSLNPKLTDLEGLSFLADQRLFHRLLNDVLFNEAYQQLTLHQRATELSSLLSNSGLVWGGRVPFPEALMQSLSRIGHDDPLLLMKDLIKWGPVFFKQHYTDRAQVREKRPDAYVEKMKGVYLNDVAKSRLATYSSKLVDENPVSPIYFVEKFHRFCARQGLAISTHVGDASLYQLEHASRHVLEKAFSCAKREDWNAYEETVSSLEFKLIDRIPSYTLGRAVLSQIKQAIAKTSWAALETTQEASPETVPRQTTRQSAISNLSLSAEISALYALSSQLNRHSAENRKKFSNLWVECFEGKDLLPLAEWVPDDMKARLATIKQHMTPFLVKQHEKFSQHIRSALDGGVALSDSARKVFASHLARIELISPDVNDPAFVKAFSFKMDWFTKENFEKWSTQLNEKQIKQLNSAFMDKIAMVGLIDRVGLTAEFMQREDNANMHQRKPA